MVVLEILIGAVGGAILLTCLPGTILWLLGFREAGVAAFSCAAKTHKKIGNVVAGSLFALFQSLGSAGIPGKILCGLCVTGAVLGCVVGFMV